MKCFYHSADLDGHCSGELVRRAHPDCEMIGIDYGVHFPWGTIEEGEIIYMVDFSLQPWTDMVRLSRLCSLVWFDHHKSSIESCLGQPIKHRGKTAIGLGACALVWEFFHGEDIPDVVRLLAEYDVWNHNDPLCLPFQYGMRLYRHSPGSPVWDEVFSQAVVDGKTGFDRVVEEGTVVLSYQTQDNRIRAEALCFDTVLGSLVCIAANQGLSNSQLFDSVWDPSRYDAMLTFHWRKGRWNVSLYSSKPNIDVSLVAKAHGGGGHKNAAGFQCDELPFKLGVQPSKNNVTV